MGTAAEQAGIEPYDENQGIEPVQGELRNLTPANEPQRLLQARALEVSGLLAEAHWMLVESSSEGLPTAFLIILVFWLAWLFLTFGLQAPANPTVIGVMMVCSLSVAAAVFLVIDMGIRIWASFMSRTGRCGQHLSTLPLDSCASLAGIGFSK